MMLLHLEVKPFPSTPLSAQLNVSEKFGVYFASGNLFDKEPLGLPLYNVVGNAPFKLHYTGPHQNTTLSSTLPQQYVVPATGAFLF
jgi:hypothetical protein